MRLSDLEPKFLKIINNKLDTTLNSIVESDGIIFLCPVCFKANNGPIGTHSIICWRPHVDKEKMPGPGRWEFQGSGIEDLTLVAGSSSILLTGGCNAHFYIRNGSIEF